MQDHVNSFILVQPRLRALTNDNVGVLGVFEILPESSYNRLRIFVDIGKFHKFSESYPFSNKKDWLFSVDRNEVVSGRPYVFERYLGCTLKEQREDQGDTYELIVSYAVVIDMHETVRTLHR